MGVQFERLSGNTSTFAFKVSFQDDPDEGYAVDPDEAGSWGSIQIWVGGRNLCAHTEESEYVDSVHWYLLPMMEWLVRNWNALLHEERLPIRNSARTAWIALQETAVPPPAVQDDPDKCFEWEEGWSRWWQRHSLLHARQGGLFPDIVLRRYRDEVEVSWGPTALAGMPEYYTFYHAEGFARIDPRQVAHALYDTLLPAVQFLHSQKPDSLRLTRLVQATKSLREENVDRRLSWLAGLGSLEEQIQAAWQYIRTSISEAQGRFQSLLQTEQDELVISGSCHAALMFGTLSPDVQKDDVMLLAGFMVDLAESDSEFNPFEQNLLPKLVARPFTKSSPWEQGYRMAMDVLNLLVKVFPEETYTDISKLLHVLGVICKEESLSDENIRGIAVAGPKFRPGILINMCHAANQFPSGIRFSLAHELCHLLFDRALSRKLAIASGPWAPIDIEQRANAFAAMLLMPPATIHRAIRDHKIDPRSNASILQLARVLQTSRTALIQHLVNLTFITETDKERLDMENDQQWENPEGDQAL